MKPLKLVALSLAAAAALLLGLALLALHPDVQTWGVRRALAGSPVAVERVAAGWSEARIEGVTVQLGDISVRLGSVTTRDAAWAWIRAGRIDLEEVVVRDALLNLAPTSAAAASPTPGARAPPDSKAGPAPGQTGAAAPGPFSGILAGLRLPAGLRLGRLATEGRAVLAPTRSVTFELTVRNVAADGEAEVTWKADFVDPTPAADLAGLRSTGRAIATLGPAGEFTRLTLDATTAARGPALPADEVLLSAEVKRASGGAETYAARLGLRRGGRNETLLSSTAAFAPGQTTIAGQWEVAIRSEQLAALLAGFGLPEVAATGGGRFTLSPDGTAGSAEGKLQAAVSRLQQVSPALAALGSVQLAAAFDVTVADHAARLRTFEVTLHEAAGRRLVELRLAQEASYRLTDRRVTLARPGADAARLVLDHVPIAWGQPLAEPLRLAAGTVSVALALQGETDGSRVRVQTAEPLAIRALTIRDAAGRPLVEELNLTARPFVDYTPARLEARLDDLRVSLPAGDALSGEVVSTTPLSGPAATTAFRARLEARLISLLRPLLAFDPGPLTARLDVAGRREAAAVSLDRAEASLTRADQSSLATLRLLQPLRFEPGAGRLSTATPSAAAVEARFGEFPLSWANPYLGPNRLGGSCAGGQVSALWSAEGAVSVATTSPLRLREVSLASADRALLAGLDFGLEGRVSRQGPAFAFDLRKVEASQGGTRQFHFSAAGEVSPGKDLSGQIKGTLEAHAGLLRQPGLQGLAEIVRGRVETAFDAALRADGSLHARVELATRDLVPRTGPAPGDVRFTLTTEAKADGSATFLLPLTVTAGGRSSDLRLEGTFGAAKAPAHRTFTVRASSETLVLDDLQAFAALAPASASSPPPAAPPPASRPGGHARAGTPSPSSGPASRETAPPWRGFQGRADLDLKRVLHGRDFAARGIRGAFTLTESRLAVDGLQGSFRDQPFAITAALTFQAGQPEPYALAGQVDVAGVAVGDLLRSANPGEKPVLESTVKVAARLSGRGATVPAALGRTSGRFEISGGKGVLRALGRKGESVGAASALLGLAGALAGSQNTVALGQLGRELEEMQFDRFTLTVERDAALNFRAPVIEFVSPTKRLTGRGAMAWRADAPFTAWPFEFEFVLAGKGFMAQLLNEARVLSGQSDDQGYFPMASPFTVSGTAAEVNNSLWKILAGSAARAGLEGLLRR